MSTPGTFEPGAPAWRLLDALGCDYRCGRTSWTVRCPMPDHGKGYGDRNPSLGVKLGRKGLALKCGTGCQTCAIVAYLGFKLRDLFYEQAEPPRPNLAELEDRWRRGDLKPALPPVTRNVVTRDVGLSLINVPSDKNNVPSDRGLSDELGPTARRVLADLLFVTGLYAAVGETRPVPYSVRFCAERMGWEAEAGYRRASRTIVALEKMGYIRCAEVLQPRGKRYGTKCYLPTAGWLATNVDSEDRAQARSLGGPPIGASSNDNNATGLNPDAELERLRPKVPDLERGA